MSDDLKLVPNEEKDSGPTFTYNEETAKKTPPGYRYVGEFNVRDACPDLYPDDNESPETKERCERALNKFWRGKDWYLTVRQVITVGYNHGSVSLLLEDSEQEELPDFITDRSWEEILEEVRKEFSWINSPESGLRMKMAGIDVPGEEIRRMKIEIKGVYPFYIPFLKESPALTPFFIEAIDIKFYHHLCGLRKTLKTPKKTGGVDEILQELKEAFKPFEQLALQKVYEEKKASPKLRVISNEEKGEIE